MKLHRFYYPNFELPIVGESLKITNVELVHQLSRVLRFEPGREFVIFSGQDPDFFDVKCIFVEFKKNSITSLVKAVDQNNHEPQNSLTLYLSILKKENFELVVEKAVELGVYKIIPVITARTIKTALRLDRLNKIAQEAAEQSGRGWVPVVVRPVSFIQALELAKQHQKNYFCHFFGEQFVDSRSQFKDFGVWIGPEGGFDVTEVALAQKYDFYMLKLSPLTLRAETAAIVSCHQLLSSEYFK